LLALLVPLYCYVRVNGLTLKKALTEFRMLDAGDDNIIQTKRPMDWPKVYAEFGWVAKTIERRNIFDVTFCSGRFWPSNDGLVLGPKIGKWLFKTGWSIAEVLADVPQNEFFAGVCLGVSNDVNHIPVLRSVVSKATSDCPKASAILVNRHAHRQHAIKSHEAVFATYLMLSHLYGLDVELIVALEDKFKLMNFPVLFSDPVLDQIFQIDL
jgi:hypothetical protein